MPTPPVALTIAGSDCSSGAGIQADLKTFQHFHVHGLTAVTCIVSETANIVRAVHPVPLDIVTDQVELMFDAFPIAALKTGMLLSTPYIEAMTRIFSQRTPAALVVDPVMIASTGDTLLDPTAVTAYKEQLFPLARVITPNLPEAETLLGEKIPDAASLEPAARKLAILYRTNVLLKGGHLDSPDCLDLLIENGKVHRFSTPRLDVPGSHGTGCTLSAAIAARLALGDDLPAAVAAAKDYLTETLRSSYQYGSPSGEIVHALNQGTV
ncbi:MAG: bifunctional hydroxymethylpyrimidine kinase/phosphomethylpyrimidine kinase [Akkermansiaceae bacterium]|nr:bifunctional hydroxymethylpyrimidine kinase/phosphomethylpyrimidine kinase [Akkermansiaceae bacterium]